MLITMLIIRIIMKSTTTTKLMPDIHIYIYIYTYIHIVLQCTITSYTNH